MCYNWENSTDKGYVGIQQIIISLRELACWFRCWCHDVGCQMIVSESYSQPLFVTVFFPLCWRGCRKHWLYPLQRCKILPHKKRGVFSMTLNGIWWWGFSSGALGIVGYPYIAISPRSTLTCCGNTCYGPL